MFDLFKALYYIESSHQSEKLYFPTCVRNMFWIAILNKNGDKWIFYGVIVPTLIILPSLNYYFFLLFVSLL